MDGSQAVRADVSRAVGRLSSDYVLRALRLLSDLHRTDLLTAIITQAIIAANTSHLSDAPAHEDRYAGRNDLPPDEARRPVSVLALADSLGLPFETTRRRVNKLIEAGRCVRVRGGVIVPSSVLDRKRYFDAQETNIGYVQHFVRGLRRIGLELD